MCSYLFKDTHLGSTSRKCKWKRSEIYTADTPIDCKENHNGKLEESTFTDKNPVDSETETSLCNRVHDSKAANENAHFSTKLDSSYVVSEYLSI